MPLPNGLLFPGARMESAAQIQMAAQRQNSQGLVSTMPGRVSAVRNLSAVRNDYRCSIERNQGGKYCVRIRVRYPRHAWLLGVFFLASNFDKAMKKLEESVDFLQRHEEKLWFWGVYRAEDMGFSAEFLREAGLRRYCRIEFPPKAVNLALAPERNIPAFALGSVRRGLAESMEGPRPVYADAGD